MHLPILLMLLLIVAGPAMAQTHVPTEAEVLKTLRREHPRLIASADDFGRLRKQYQADPAFWAVAQTLIASADKIGTEPASKYEIPDGKRLLATSRRVLDRVQTLAVAYHLTGDRKYVDRAYAELESAAAFKDWNPSHFLDTAEMSAAFGFGYDWLYAEWTPEQRKTIREALVKHGLKAGLEGYQKNAWWGRSNHNWNQVCNGGLTLGALAIADEEPELAAQIVSRAVALYPRALVSYGPDGAWAEGPGYWSYATQYTARPLAALKSALGTDFGLSDTPGLDKAGLFAVHMLGPSGKLFNFADAGSGWGGSADLWWLADRYDQPLLRIAQKPYALRNPKPLDLLWGRFDAPDQPPAGTPTDAYFRGTEVAMFRTAWGDPNALFVGLKSGANPVNHSNLDLGSIVLDAHGQRFIVDLGPDNYNLPAYFGKARWTYYRLRAEGHNTLVIRPGQDPDQDPKAATKITQFHSSPKQGAAVTDLTAAYPGAQSVRRGVALRDRDTSPYVLVQDEIDLGEAPQPTWWFAHTQAEIALAADGRSAVLTQNKRRLRVALLEPADAKFTIRDAKPLPTSPQPAGQNENQGVRKLAIELPKVAQVRIAVAFQPVADAETPVPDIKLQPLDGWPK